MLIRRRKLSFWLSALSLLGLAVLMASTNPIDKIIYAVVFFVLALVFLISFGYWVVGAQLGEVSPKNRYRIVAVSLIILTLLMFRSAQSLNWVDALILVLISFGLVFYISRRG
ncbi:hypothetical protein KW801_01900 [Candidatus Saccharibacteria bacterium]|nr:hypothetical protein [Candidatus Saccharibacteria bacterium]